MLPMHSNVTIKNVSWPHFSWATPYIGKDNNDDDDNDGAAAAVDDDRYQARRQGGTPGYRAPPNACCAPCHSLSKLL